MHCSSIRNGTTAILVTISACEGAALFSDLLDRSVNLDVIKDWYVEFWE